MGRPSVKCDGETAEGTAARIRFGERTGVRHHAGINAVQTVLIEHESFSSDGFLGGGSEKDDPGRDIFEAQFPCDGEEGAERSGADQIVTAGMAEFGQGIVFRSESEGRAVRTAFRAEGRFETAIRHEDIKAVLFEDLLLAGGGMEFTQTDLRIPMDGGGKFPERFAKIRKFLQEICGGKLF